MIDYRKQSYELFNSLLSHPLFQAMECTVEGSPWHREANVLVHTKMVLDEYVRRTDMVHDEWTRQDFIGAVECIWHDTGKPPAQIEKYSEKRGTYRAYHGHEILSARLFEDWACSPAQRGMFTAIEIAQVVFMMEQHMPWSIEKPAKLDQLAMTAKAYGAEIYMRTLLADQFGRTSDDWHINTARSDEWVQRFAVRVAGCREVGRDAFSIYIKYPDIAEGNMVLLPIAPSGAGKSTLLKQYQGLDFSVGVFSLDELRHRWYDPADYKKAYELAVADKKFEGRADAEYIATLKERKFDLLYIDNTNVGANRRRKYLAEAVKRKYRTRAQLMPASLQLLIDRQKTRGDKDVPINAVRQQYMNMAGPLLGEFDSIHVSDHNIR